ncbi:MAG: alpha/beta fold hydrolase [Candidatus Eiseniibacteriota bacterium]
MSAPLERTERSLKGCRIPIRRGGRGPRLFILHGGGGPSNWYDMAAALTDRYEVWLPEHPGFAGADDPAWLDGVGDLAYFYLSLLDDLDLRDVHLVGHSLGGWIAAEMAVRNAARLASLVLVSAAGLSVAGVERPDNFLWTRAETIRALYADGGVADALLAHEPSDDEAIAAFKNQCTVAKLVWNPRWHNPDLGKWLDRVRLPVKIIWGDTDRLFAPVHAEAFATLIPGASVDILAGCGHLPHVEQPEEWRRRLDRFIEGRAA